MNIVCAHCGTQSTNQHQGIPWCTQCGIWLVHDEPAGQWVSFAEHAHRQPRYRDLQWRADNNNQVLIDAGLHRDELRVGIRRGQRSWTFLVMVETCPDNTTRMISQAAPR